jgi:hypothetical protein
MGPDNPSGPIFIACAGTTKRITGVLYYERTDRAAGQYYERVGRVGVIEDLIKLAIIPIVVLCLPILFTLVFDIAAHLGELFNSK